MKVENGPPDDDDEDNEDNRCLASSVSDGLGNKLLLYKLIMPVAAWPISVTIPQDAYCNFYEKQNNYNNFTNLIEIVEIVMK